MPKKKGKGKDRASTKGRQGPPQDEPDAAPLAEDAHGLGQGADPLQVEVGGGPVGDDAHGLGHESGLPPEVLLILQAGPVAGDVPDVVLGGIGHGGGMWPFTVPHNVGGVKAVAVAPDQPAAPNNDDGGGVNMREPKKTGRKASRRDTSDLDLKDYILESDTEAEDKKPDPVDLNSEFLAALKFCKQFEDNVYAIRVQNMILIKERFLNLPVIWMDSDLSPQHLTEFYGSSGDFYSHVYPQKVEFTLSDGTRKSIPVTTDKEAEIERTHHIVAMRRAADRKVALFIVQNYSGYLVGGKVVHEKEDWAAVKWGVFGEEPLPPAFGADTWTRIKYGPRYTSQLEHVAIEDGVGNKIIRFFESFRDGPNGNYDQEPSDFGHLMIETVIVIVCEGRRFQFVEDWAVGTRGRIGWWFSTVLKDWLTLCKCILYLLLYNLEARLSKDEGDMMSLLSKLSKDHALQWWETEQIYLASTLFPQFFVKAPKGTVQVVPAIEVLGRHIKLIRNDEALWKLISMRKLGYDGQLMEEIGEPLVRKVPSQVDGAEKAVAASYVEEAAQVAAAEASYVEQVEPGAQLQEDEPAVGEEEPTAVPE